GLAGDIAEAPQMVTSTEGDEVRVHGLPTLGSALVEHPGIHVQESARGQVSPFLRGLTGYHVLNLIDGIRYNNTAFRSGPNQYLAFVDPASVETVETTLGPASSEYGSDALGGTIHILTPPARFSPDGGPLIRGRLAGFLQSADLAAGTSAEASLSGARLALLVGGNWRRHSDVQTGRGCDSHNVLTRLLGLSGDDVRSLLGSRLQDTAFDQYGGHLRAAWRITDRQQLTGWYQQGEQRGVRGYKDLWGGLGRLQADFRPQRLRLFYGRYIATALGPLDSLTATFSVNAQSDGFVSQGLRFTDPVSIDRTQVTAYGYSAQARTHFGSRQIMVFGGELYDEKADSLRLVFPAGTRYRTAAAYAQTVWEPANRRWRLAGGGRITGVGFQSRSFTDLTYNASASVRAFAGLRVYALVSRGFRAPNLNDLGTAGLQDLGYEVPAETLRGTGALVGNSSGESALSTGEEVKRLGSERLMNYEAGLSWQSSLTRIRTAFFDGEFYDAIARRTVLFPIDGAPGKIAGIPVRPLAPTPAQAAQGVTAVSTEFDTRAVKAFVNVGRQRYYGTEVELRQSLPRSLSATLNYSFLCGRELNPNRNVRRLPPQSLWLSLTYTSPSRFWLEGAMEAAGAQRRLSGGDLSDERIGGERSRNDIAAFFNGGRLSPSVERGIFIPTGETLVEIQDRVLPRSVA
ncbi:MAG: TonB-dependent receptor, partial [Acidobacteria bacterium]|nr:TonB-dependent receptor [Acidobacteriota bacterium]